jgi:D-threo-aldose 1-dehydrogenase
MSLDAIVLGTATLGNLGAPMSEETAAAIVEAARSAGIMRFDTAPLYGLGLAERRLGDALAGVPRNDYVLSTKVGRLLNEDPEASGDEWAGFHVSSRLRPRWDLRESGIRRSIEGSLDRLRVDRLDIAFLHDPHLAEWDDAVLVGLAGLDTVRAEGLVDRIGVATKDLPSLERALSLGGVDVVMIPGRLTLLNQDAAAVAASAARSGVEVWNAAPLAAGALAGAPLTESGYGSISEREREALLRVEAACDRLGVDMVAAALQGALRMTGVDQIVIGASTADQIRQNVDHLLKPLPRSLWDDLGLETGA